MSFLSIKNDDIVPLISPLHFLGNARSKFWLNTKIIMFKCLLYIDPGTGSLLYQIILSAVLTVSVFWGRVKLFVHYIIAKFTGKKD